MKLKFTSFVIILFVLALSHFEVNAQDRDKLALNYINRYKEIAMFEMQEYKIPASITLAQGLLESGSGNSTLAKKSNNHFGIKCHKDWKGRKIYYDDDKKGECFRVYDTPEDSFRDHSVFLSKGQRYAFLFDLKITDYKGWAKGLKQAGYATFPGYATVLINLIERYNLTQYDQLVLKGNFKFKEKNKKEIKKEIEKEMISLVYTPYDITKSEIVGKTSDGRYIRENNRVKFIYAREGEDVYEMAKMLEIYEYQLIKYNNLGKRKKFKDNEIVYIEPKKQKATKRYKYHTIQKGETLSYVSRLYAVKLKSLYKKNNMDKDTILQIGQNIKLR